MFDTILFIDKQKDNRLEFARNDAKDGWKHTIFMDECTDTLHNHVRSCSKNWRQTQKVKAKISCKIQSNIMQHCQGKSFH